ncbi:hypothetical protein K461DRAFT_45160 [Myriangium duriaei CBS 260.36]|uniref:Transcription factor BYE1 n=1 Tax=Myriangium duriaei CBS 260.36 TaxID=1168546 RepID=A0A9P4ITF5_9PEZI|nr:hypothetical protein K461DRAFT_45160 [Myriangium duriaei CBS 260.36]
MADEPRRSGRATKGQNKTLDEPAEATPKQKKTAAKAKTTKKATPVEPEPQEEEEEAEETIRCVCGDNTDDEGGRKFICCDACEVWQHNVCMGISLDDNEQPEHYFCEQCRPEEHKELLDAMTRGEPIWEERQKAVKAAKKKGGKRGRKPTKSSRASEVKAEAPKSEASEPPAVPSAEPEPADPTELAAAPAAVPSAVEVMQPPVAPEAGVKRKFEEEEPQTTTESANGTKQEPIKPSARPEKKRKSSAKEALAANDVENAVVDISRLPKERMNPAVALATVFKSEIESKSKAGTYRIPDGETADSLSKNIASLIEYELYQQHPPAQGQKVSTNYGTQFRAILSNIKKNPALCDRLLNKTLTAASIAGMSTQDMASEELQREREKMKEEADKQAIINQEDEKPRVRRTHKGDEIVEDAASGNIDSVFTSKPVRRRESEVEGDGTGSPTTATNDIKSPTIPNDHSRPSPADIRRRSSSNFDITNVWAKTAASPTTEQPSKPFPPPNGHAAQPPVQNKATGDADIDRLLADDDDTYSPADVKSSDSEVVFRGSLAQSGVASLTISARFVAGNDFSRFMPWSSFLPSQFEIEGRLERSKADDYLCGLQWSKRSDVTVLALSPYDNRDAFDTIFTYFHSRGRYAVGSKKYGCSELVKDLYISPVEKGGAAPPHIDLLDYCSLTFPAPERLLLATFVVNKPASWDGPDIPIPLSTGGRQSLAGPAGSPVNPQFSPAPHHGFTPEHPLPPNPYGAAPPQQELRFSPTAAGILGPYVECPVAKQILAATEGKVEDFEAGNMRSVFDRSVESRSDMSVFGQMLSN